MYSVFRSHSHDSLKTMQLPVSMIVRVWDEQEKCDEEPAPFALASQYADFVA
jgi:hypothetical protein